MKIILRITLFFTFTINAWSYSDRHFEDKVSDKENLILWLAVNQPKPYLRLPLFRGEHTYYTVPNELCGIIDLGRDDKIEIEEFLSAKLHTKPDWEAKLCLEFHLFQIIRHNGVFVSKNKSFSTYSILK